MWKDTPNKKQLQEELVNRIAEAKNGLKRLEGILDEVKKTVDACYEDGYTDDNRYEYKTGWELLNECDDSWCNLDIYLHLLQEHFCDNKKGAAPIDPKEAKYFAVGI